MKRTTLLSAALLAIALPLAAQDATSWTPGETFLANWDYDGDGIVTLDEVEERRGDLFASFDADEDGLLTPEEFAAHDQMREAMQAARADPARGWGQPQGRGMRSGMGRGGGQGFGRRGGQQGFGQDFGQDFGQGFGRGYGPGGGAGGAGQAMAMLDANGDGAVSEAEFVSAGTGWFARFDRSGDGAVTAADFGIGLRRP